MPGRHGSWRARIGRGSLLQTASCRRKDLRAVGDGPTNWASYRRARAAPTSARLALAYTSGGKVKRQPQCTLGICIFAPVHGQTAIDYDPAVRKLPEEACIAPSFRSVRQMRQAGSAAVEMCPHPSKTKGGGCNSAGDRDDGSRGWPREPPQKPASRRRSVACWSSSCGRIVEGTGDSQIVPCLARPVDEVGRGYLEPPCADRRR